LLDDVVSRRPPLDAADEVRRARAAKALERGLGLILAAQVRVEGRLTIWAAQYDPVTLAPRPARAFEPTALSTRESASITRFLIRRVARQPTVAQAIEAAISWFEGSLVPGIRVEARLDGAAPLGWDRVVVPDPAAGPVWARFYDIATNRPVFVGRDGAPRATLAELEYERRTGYAWYGTWATDLLRRDYPKWKAGRTP
jgi:PelA/Pel-15E family pectate lyase